tara:strand:+ start:3121 stop:3291 length:171 start_codon:yes stop_codon:yes gene_type:complete
MNIEILEDLVVLIHSHAKVIEDTEGVTTESMFMRRTADTLSNMASDRQQYKKLYES